MRFSQTLFLLFSLTPALSFPVSNNPNDDDFVPIAETRGEILDKKVEAYCSDRLTFEKFCYRVVGTSRGLSINVASAAISYFCANVLGANEATSRAMALSTVIAHQSSRILDEIKRNLFDCGSEGMQAVQQLNKVLEKDFSKVKHLYPKEIVSAINKINLSIYEKRFTKDKAGVLNLIRRREAVLMAIPLQEKNVAHYGTHVDSEKAALMDAKVKELVATLPERNRMTLKSTIRDIRDSSLPSTNVTNKVQMYLYGPHGTGKTVFTKKLAQTLGLPLCEIQLNGNSPTELIGNGQFSSDDDDDVVFGKIFLCFIRSGVKNPILFIDEAGDYINGAETNPMVSKLKLLMEPNALRVPLVGEKIKFDISKATLILAGNSPLVNKELKSRVPQLEFDRLDEEQKQAAAKQAIEQRKEQLNKTLSTEEKEIVFGEVQKLVPFVLAMNEDFKIPGARIVQQVIRDVASDARTMLADNDRIDQDWLKNSIKEKFQKYLREDERNNNPNEAERPSKKPLLE